MLRLAALGFLLSPALARTNLAGCVSSESVATPTNGGTPYATVMWYVPESGEVCELLDCGGGRAPPKTTVPGCPQYKGTATYSPSFISVGAQMTSKAELPPAAASASSASTSAAAAISSDAMASSSIASVVASVSSDIESAIANMTSAIGAMTSAAPRNATTSATSAPLTSSTATDDDEETTSVATATSTRLSSASVTRASSSSSATSSQGAASGIQAGLGSALLVAGVAAAHLF
ncbi:hypothetical protein CDD82_6307 [Ophiocordyceps australis]|uniref:Siderophore biosynthesis enzyme n=1 Tax=Ophiocordyceps australis TaxID=1399860 RepID=A0A2C5ZR86_9HYPO|nr:hypothetical protein CDD82_6307 [Ophiocordyceps australis]